MNRKLVKPYGQPTEGYDNGYSDVYALGCQHDVGVHGEQQGVHLERSDCMCSDCLPRWNTGMSHWTEEWTIESVENNYNAIGCIDPEDVVQLIAEAKELQYLYKWLGHRHMSELLQMAGEQEDEENA